MSEVSVCRDPGGSQANAFGCLIFFGSFEDTFTSICLAPTLAHTAAIAKSVSKAVPPVACGYLGSVHGLPSVANEAAGRHLTVVGVTPVNASHAFAVLRGR